MIGQTADGEIVRGKPRQVSGGAAKQSAVVVAESFAALVAYAASVLERPPGCWTKWVIGYQ